VTFTIPLPKKIDDDLAAEVEKQAVYAAPQLTRIRVTDDRMSVEIDSDADESEVRPKVERYLSAMVGRYRKIAGKVLHKVERKDSGALETNVYEKLKERGWAIELGMGQVGLAGPALALARCLDEHWRALGISEYAAAEQNYPALIDADILRRCGYYTSFPHAVSFIVHLSEDFDLIEEFRQANDGADALVVPDPHAFGTPKVCAKPATCYHCYQGLEGRSLDGDGAAFTAVGKCFRYESKNTVGLDRLWDFTMREIIFVGTESFVNDQRESSMGKVLEQLREWDVDCEIETANDPFFASMYASKTFWQMRGDLKYEMKLAIEPGPDGAERRIAAGSFNLHENFFGKTFTITAGGEPAFTGCTAFGIERWVLALFTQHGFEPERWPESLRRDVFA
jgi:seryl-tRNA synthetase